MKEFRKDESGQSLVLVGLTLTTLLGFLGLAIDVGLLYRTRQQVQIAADAASVAAELDYLYNRSVSSAQTAGRAASAANGFTHGIGGVTVTINVPPASGPNTSGNFVEAIVNTPKTMTFAAAVLRYATMNIAARAVSGMPTNGDACIWLMKTSGVGMDLQGSYNIQSPACGIYINSPDSNAVNITGNGGTMNAKFVNVVGNVTPQHQTSPTQITKNTAPRKNPFGNLNGPSVPGGCTSTFTTTLSITTANQATYRGSASNNVVCFTKAVTLKNGVALSGASTGVVYVFQSGVTIPSGATVTLGSGTYNAGTGTFSNTTGAVMEIYGGTLSQASNALLNVYAPTAGSFNGIAILQPSSNTTNLQVQFGSNNQTLDGYIYAPGAEVFLQDSGGGINALGIVAGWMYNKTSALRIASYDVANSATTPNRVISLVE